jgi:hypothetical protein
MKSNYFLLSFLLVSMIACKKSNGGKPEISVESVNTVIPVGGSLDAKIKFQQTNGKLAKGTFIAIRNRLNERPLSNGSSSPDTLIGPIPDFPNNNTGEFHYTLDYFTYLHQSDSENDTIMFKFAVIDTDGNKSDTVSTNKIVVLFQ